MDAGEHERPPEATVRSGLVRSVSRRRAAGLALRLLAGVVLVAVSEAAGTEDRVDPPCEQRRATERRSCWGAGDVTRSAFANSFLRIFVREESLGRALPDRFAHTLGTAWIA